MRQLLTRPKKLFSSTRPATGFTHLQTLQAEDLNLQITRLLHQKSGAMIYNIKSSDKDNTFAPIVKTLPENDTGCPHILEHLACCGSQRYPVRDPFFNMLRRSVNTYMNAWTGDDFTAYPFSSANAKDFQNLYKVYLDMCLKPLLNQLDFRQQGWRYEINPQTLQKQLKGIVFNQMKGAYQNPDRQLYIQIANKLYSTTPYSYDSGGKPESIVRLSYEQVREMHRYYYHPSNMAFYYYGQGDIGGLLGVLEEEYLSKFGYKNSVDQYVAKSRKLMEKMPTRIQKIFHKVTSQTAQTPNIALSFNLGPVQQMDGIDITCLNIISYLLLQTNQAILYQQFIEGHLADSFGPSEFNIGSLLSFGITLKNVRVSSQEVLKRVEGCIEDMIKNGVNERRLEQYVRQQELDILTPKQTQGIAYLGQCLPYMNNRLPLYNLSKIRSNLNSAVVKLKDRDQLRQLLTRCFLKNERKVVVRQEPAENKGEQQYKNLVGLDMFEQVIKKQQEELKNRQENKNSKQNSVQCLPKLSLNDLMPSVPKEYETKLERETKNHNLLKQLHVKIDIKDINFVRVIFKLDMSNQENAKILPFLDIWAYSIKHGIAVNGLTNKELSSKLALCSNDFRIVIEKGSQYCPTDVNIIFSASCLSQNISQYINLLKKIIFEPQYKPEDISNIFRSYKTEKVEELLDGNVMQYCLDYGSSMIAEQARVFNKYYWVAQGISTAVKGEVPKQFSLIHNNIKESADITIVQHSKEFVSGISQKLGFETIGQKTAKQTKLPNKKPLKSSPGGQQVSVTNSYDVNFCSQQYPGPEVHSKQHAQLILLVELLEQDYLHQKIREKGGAYGARAVIRDVGTVALYSYMDPNSTDTYTAFEDSIKEVLASQITKQRLEELKIKVIGSLETPLVPQRQCINRILKDFTNAERTRFIENIRSAQWPQILKTGHKYLQGNVKSRVMFGKDVPKGFTEQKLKIPKQQKIQEGHTQQVSVGRN